MKTVITLEIDDNELAISEKNATGVRCQISNDVPGMVHEICDHLRNYLLYERDADKVVEDYEDFVEKHSADVVDKDSLVGEHVLSGAVYANDYSGFNAMLFILDGQTYLAACDPDDGYRSYLGSFFKTDRKCPQNLPDIRIEIQHKAVREQISAYERRDYKGYVFVIKDARFREDLIMELGTDYSEDYYPCCVMHYMPENVKEVAS